MKSKDGFPAKYVQHNIPLSTEEYELQHRRASGDISVTPEMEERAKARTIKAHWAGKEMPESTKAYIEKWLGEK